MGITSGLCVARAAQLSLKLRSAHPWPTNDKDKDEDAVLRS